MPVATSYTVADETLTVRVHSASTSTAYAPMLASVDLDVPGHDRAATPDGAYTLTLPAGRVALGVRRPDPAAQQVRRDHARRRRRPRGGPAGHPVVQLLDLLPADEPQERFRALVEVIPTRPPMLTLNVQEPLADDVRGQRNQYRLRHAAQVEEATQDSVFFRALYSEVANCNMLGVHHELGRRGTVADPLLVGARPLGAGARGRRAAGRGHAGVARGAGHLALRDGQRPPARLVPRSRAARC